MRILLVTTWFPSRRAPTIGTFVQKDAELLAMHHDVRIVQLIAPALVSGDDADVVGDGIPITRIPMSTTDPRDPRRAWSALQPHLDDADVLHTQAFSTLLPFAGRKVERPWVHTEHWSGLSTPSTLPLSWRAALPVLRPLLRKPDVVTAVCRYLAAPVERERAGPIRIVPCIVPPRDRLIDAPRDPDHLRLVSVGGLLDRKDPLCAVDTVQVLRARGVPATLEWIGEGELRPAAEQRVRELGLEDAVRFPGTRNSRGVSAALDAADVFFLPTKGENFCVSAAEAIVHGRPVVVGAVGGQGEYLTPETGELVSEQSPAVYAEAVQRIVAQTAGTSAARIAATIGDRFSPGVVLSGYEAAYAEAGAP